jgi:hypothetical protein
MAAAHKARGVGSLLAGTLGQVDRQELSGDQGHKTSQCFYGTKQDGLTLWKSRLEQGKTEEGQR